MNPGLYVVATPIGNLGDLSPRAVQTLRSADLIAVEDRRHSGRLFGACDVDTPTLSYHDHSAAGALDRIVACLRDDGRVALICDAGTPLISDPGYRLVRRAQDNGFAVYAVPGACAAIAALSVAGLPTDRFRFEGFLPPRAAPREKRLEVLGSETVTLVFYEAPHRLQDSLRSMVRVLGGRREAVLARELTKVFETVRRDSLAALADFVAADSHQSRGEIVLLVAGAARDPDAIGPEAAALVERLARELPPRRAAAVVADVTGLRRQALYDHLLRHRR